MQSLKISRDTIKKMKGFAKVIYVIARICWILMLVFALLFAFIGTLSIFIFGTVGIYNSDGSFTEFGQSFDTSLTNGFIQAYNGDGMKIDEAKQIVYDWIAGEHKETFMMLVTTVVVGGTMEFAAMIFLLMKLDKLFKNITTCATPFCKENSKIIRWIGWGVVACFVVEWIFGTVVNSVLAIDSKLNTNINLGFVLLVLALFALSYVFDYAYELQKNYISAAKNIEE